MRNRLPLRTTTVLIVIVSLFYASVAKSQSLVNKTKFGLYPVKDSIGSRLIASDNINVDYIRYTILLSTWNGTNSSGLDYWIARNKKIVLNINNDNTPSYFPTNLTDYKSKLQSVLNVYAKNVDLVVIENEELNNGATQTLAHWGSLQSYINELNAAASVCKKQKVPLTNGGLATQVAASLKHYYDINGKTDSSKWLVTQMGSITADPTVWQRCDSLLDAYKTMNINYVNLHWYEPNGGLNRITGVIPTICNYITTRTGKKVVTNESGTRGDSTFVTQVLQQWSIVNPDYCILFDGIGNSNGAMPLTSPTGALLPAGMAYRDYVGGAKACSQNINISPSGFVNSCAGSTITLTASGNLSNYLWNTGETTKSITVSATGNYSVKSTQAKCNVYAKTASAIMMNPLPVNPLVTTTPSSVLNLCQGKSANLSSTIALTYKWSTGEKTKSIKVGTQGKYTVTVSDINGCQSTSDITAVTYNDCNPPGSLSVNGITNNKATLNWVGSSCSAGYNIQYSVKGKNAWTSVDLVSGNASSKTIYNLTSATYQWRMLTYCSYSPDTVRSVYINGPDFTVNSKKVSNAFAATLNNDDNDFNVNLFPVPATNVASVSVSNVSDDLKITMTDMYGRTLWQSEKISSSIINLPVQNLASGIYMIVVKDKLHSKTLRLVKQ